MNTLPYRISLGLTIALTFFAFIFLFPWFGALVKGVGRLPFLSLLPWTSLILLALAAVNCVIRKRVIMRR